MICETNRKNLQLEDVEKWCPFIFPSASAVARAGEAPGSARVAARWPPPNSSPRTAGPSSPSAAPALTRAPSAAYAPSAATAIHRLLRYAPASTKRRPGVKCQPMPCRARVVCAWDLGWWDSAWETKGFSRKRQEKCVTTKPTYQWGCVPEEEAQACLALRRRGSPSLQGDSRLASRHFDHQLHRRPLLG